MGLGLAGVVTGICGMLAATCALAAPADDPPLSLAVRDTAEVWGGSGQAWLNKLQISGTLDGAGLGLSGWRAHAQIYRLDGESLSDRIGDIQTVSNLDAPRATRLFEAWIERAFGPEDKPALSIRAGLMDLNADFDSIDAATLFINSSHGIGPDLSRSGLTDPSIYPVTALGGHVVWNVDDRLTLRAALFDGVAGDPERPNAFVAERLSARDGVLGIAEADIRATSSLIVAFGGWAYSRPLQPAIASDRPPEPDHGGYLSVSTPTPKAAGWAWWVRAGFANPQAQTIGGYLGAGWVRKGIGARKDDRVGFAVARAEIGAPARAAFGLPRAETTWEATYQAKLSNAVALQPDVQYVVHPAGEPRRPDAVVVGLRVILTGAWPKPAKPEDATDPTVPPDTPDSDAANGSSSRDRTGP